ncbi:MAG: bifunctional 5,10-methylenetetrahydrofolate dehydrogenase/5,10-methenyltetrahydrofolate cyclohydrolase [Parcubacteria group bacterium]|nr:bifunctional 5,10-methylenetetrahydrofolate dehydrogenase/5,10-methenyltetrahydrofolate cyclohydrolase [Parcubacteria group bacterium]MCR4343052.1 bifunctional 5,10-methylenetetrahydrofolate dehydrogenase/5,10-methenyltetrahydrofolate cyclohydrolase [Patescibacteria group bacterium]
MIIDGKKIAEDIKQNLKDEIKSTDKQLRLAIIQVGEDMASSKFVEKKEKFAEEIGVKTKVYKLRGDISTSKLRKKISEITHPPFGGKKSSGVIVQLPLPSHINTQYILNSIPLQKDVDVLSSRAIGEFVSGKSSVLPPVVGAIKEIFLFGGSTAKLADKNVVVVGAGLLVGKPAANWLINEGATVSVLNKDTLDISKFTKEADIIISGAGSPGLIKPEMIKDGVVLIDAGTSEQAGKLVGDIDPACRDKASLFTPVPGGVGPITVAMVFKNLVELNK